MLFRPPGTHEQTERQKYGAKEGRKEKMRNFFQVMVWRERKGYYVYRRRARIRGGKEITNRNNATSEMVDSFFFYSF
jgi:hypothetical protein